MEVWGRNEMGEQGLGSMTPCSLEGKGSPLTSVSIWATWQTCPEGKLGHQSEGQHMLGPQPHSFHSEGDHHYGQTSYLVFLSDKVYLDNVN